MPGEARQVADGRNQYLEIKLRNIADYVIVGPVDPSSSHPSTYRIHPRFVMAEDLPIVPDPAVPGTPTPRPKIGPDAFSGITPTVSVTCTPSWSATDFDVQFGSERFCWSSSINADHLRGGIDVDSRMYLKWQLGESMRPGTALYIRMTHCEVVEVGGPP